MIQRVMARVLAVLGSLLAAAAFAAVDVNKASQADLEGVKGIGPAIAGKILDERKKGSFKSWNDMVERVSGVGEGNAAKFSAAGLTVNGQAYKGAPATAKAADKPAAAKAGEKKADAKPATKAEDKKDAKKSAAAASAPAKK